MKNVTVKVEELDYYVKEAFKSLRTNVRFCGEDKKVIVITSSVQDEGKSSVSLNLAISLTEAEKKVLFIDADLRKSVLTSRLEITGRMKGLTHFLSNQAELQDVVHSTNILNLYLILAGPMPPNPAELLGSTVFEDMIATMRKVYDYVIIDSPPLGSVIDSAVIAEQCDGAILVVASDGVSYRFVQSVKEQLYKSGCPILGAVLNKAPRNSKGRYYGKYAE